MPNIHELPDDFDAAKSLVIVPIKWIDEDGQRWMTISNPNMPDLIFPPLRIESDNEEDANIEAELRLMEFVEKLRQRFGMPDEHINWMIPRDQPTD